ncbi:hypothetical protein JRI60_21715 [Archangium violaceum]|jgi:hypothetical protein|uniref:hypothetical protein n=1 Tax=Archangium violaceum TaxID=83451 RepID=UPI0019527730|nr:hypothetical protein [Archangium violaceum]QRO01447.1 hypothetical protein JRI60_21715 [Archangium violaceum]
MPSASVRTGNTRKRPVKTDALVREAAAAATGLLDQSERVLVVYDEGGATLYYESDDAEDGIGRRKLSRAS